VNNGRMEEFLTNFIPPPILLRTFNKMVRICNYSGPYRISPLSVIVM
jgi:hypothetical protein